MIDFPASPTLGDQHVVGDRTWEFDGTRWVRLADASGGASLTPGTGIAVGASAPATPTLNQLWLDTN